MEYLLDTHALLWLFSDHPSLSQRVRDVFLEPRTKLHVSSVSFWEITIKWSLGKIELRGSWLNELEKERKANDIHWLDIKQTHLGSLMQLPFLHRDPFDRLLIAQAQAEGMVVVTADHNIHKYNVPCLW
ncbi:MAG: type II toxin-antitoxin system VapC family toxin [Desulfovermiculus sp.]